MPCIDLLHTQEVSVGSLLDPVWVMPHQESCLRLQQEELPSLTELGVVTLAQAPRCPDCYPSPVGQSASTTFTQVLVENHTPVSVIASYTPHSLDNHEYFVGKNITTLTPLGYRVGQQNSVVIATCCIYSLLWGWGVCVQVSIIQYTKPSDRKKLINDRFRELFPHIGLPLTSLRR